MQLPIIPTSQAWSLVGCCSFFKVDFLLLEELNQALLFLFLACFSVFPLITLEQYYCLRRLPQKQLMLH